MTFRGGSWLSSVCVRDQGRSRWLRSRFHVTFRAKFICVRFVLLLLVIEASLEYEGNHFVN